MDADSLDPYMFVRCLLSPAVFAFWGTFQEPVLGTHGSYSFVLASACFNPVSVLSLCIASGISNVDPRFHTISVVWHLIVPYSRGHRRMFGYKRT